MSDMTFDARLQEEWHHAMMAAEVRPVEHIIAAAGTEHASRVAVAAELDDLRMTVEELIVALGDGEASRLATRAWTVVDVLAHLASWSRQTRVEAEGLAANETFADTIPFGTSGPHVWNQRAVDERRGKRPLELLDEVVTEHDRLTDLFARLSDTAVHRVRALPRTLGDPPTPWMMPLTSMVLMTCWHGRMHLARIRTLLGTTS
jgi:hypothetical protein